MTRARHPAPDRAHLRPWLPIAAMAVVLAVTLWLGRDGRDETITARSDRLASEIRCAVCQGQSVAQSKAGSARAIYEEIVRQVEAGRGDADIRGYVVSRYGAELLLRPASSGTGALVWAMPVFVGVLAFAGLGAAFVRWRPTAGEASDADRALVAAALADKVGAGDG